jgi:hypothetical protein
MTHRVAVLIAGLALVVVAAVVAVIVINPFASHPSAGPVPATSPAPATSAPANSSTANPSTANPSTSPSTAPAPPSSGAYLGAWVGTANVFTQSGEIDAVNSLQTALGRKLNIVHTYLKWQAPFPTSSDLAFVKQGSTLLISWAGTDTQQIASGADDSWVRTRAEQIKALGKPVFLEWRWEMDRPNLRSEVHSGAEFVKAWDHIRAIFAATGVHNAAWVWCPTAKGFSDGQAAAFYPGNSEVDWICADAYPYAGTTSFAATVDPFLSWASHYDKPVMIGEFGVPQSLSAQQRAQWLRAAQRVVVANHQIKALLYFDANPAGRTPQGSYSLGDEGAALSAFRSIARLPYFNPAGTG